jgi:ATP-dependent Zn protease
MKDLAKILEPNDELNEDQLKKYVSGESSPEETRVVEKQIADSDFINDAVEGLRAISSKQKLDAYVNQLNKNLHEHLISKKEIKNKRKIKELSWIILTVIIILLLCILAYFVIKMQREKQIERHSISAQHLIKSSHNNGIYLSRKPFDQRLMLRI